MAVSYRMFVFHLKQIGETMNAYSDDVGRAFRLKSATHYD
jgi:hypothetical protein